MAHHFHSSQTFRRNQDGVALIEFAIALPFLLLLFLGLIELANLTLHHQKADKLANAMADFTTQSATISTSELQSFQLAIAPIMSPLNFSGSVIITSAIRLSNPPNSVPCNNNQSCIAWQYRVTGAASSQIGSPGGTPSLPGGYVLQRDRNVIVAEAFVNYTPLLSISSNFLPSFTPSTIYKAALFIPRQGTLVEVQ